MYMILHYFLVNQPLTCSESCVSIYLQATVWQVITTHGGSCKVTTHAFKPPSAFNDSRSIERPEWCLPGSWKRNYYMTSFSWQRCMIGSQTQPPRLTQYELSVHPIMRWLNEPALLHKFTSKIRFWRFGTHVQSMASPSWHSTQWHSENNQGSPTPVHQPLRVSTNLGPTARLKWSRS